MTPPARAEPMPEPCKPSPVLLHTTHAYLAAARPSWDSVLNAETRTLVIAALDRLAWLEEQHASRHRPAPAGEALSAEMARHHKAARARPWEIQSLPELHIVRIVTAGAGKMGAVIASIPVHSVEFIDNAYQTAALIVGAVEMVDKIADASTAEMYGLEAAVNSARACAARLATRGGVGIQAAQRVRLAADEIEKCASAFGVHVPASAKPAPWSLDRALTADFSVRTAPGGEAKGT